MNTCWEFYIDTQSPTLVEDVYYIVLLFLLLPNTKRCQQVEDDVRMYQLKWENERYKKIIIPVFHVK